MVHKGHRERARARFLSEAGFESFAEHEVLEFLLFFAIPQRDVNPIAHALIERYGSVAGVLDADVEDLQAVPGIGRNAAVLLCMLPRLMRVYTRDKWGERPLLTNQREAGAYAITLFYGRHYEAFFLICLDVQQHVISTRLMHEGTLDEAHFYTRNILEEALRFRAKSVILAHNHPGGGLMPSQSDIKATARIRSGLQACGIDVLDHIIVAQGEFMSLVEENFLESPMQGYRMVDRQRAAEWLQHPVREQTEGST